MTDLAVIMIRRQILDVEVEGTESAGLVLQRSLPALCAEVLSPTLESVLAPFDPGDDHLSVERLTIDLTSTLERLAADLAVAVERGVVDYFLKNPSIRSQAERADRPDEVRRRTEAEMIDEALVVFLRTGRLPWSFRMPPGSRLEQLVLESWAAADAKLAPSSRTRALLSEVLALKTARMRLVMQFTPKFSNAVLQSLSSRAATELAEVLSVVEKMDLPSTAGLAFTRSLWEAALTAASVGSNDAPGPNELVETAWRSIDPGQLLDPNLATFVERHWPGVAKLDESVQVKDDIETSPPATPHSLDANEESDGVLVANAGVVLLHPFLVRFFEGLGIVVNDELLDPKRALCLLHHLSTGEATAPEYALTVAKALCGVPLDEPVEADVGLTNSEVEEATALLQAAISHWGSLLNSSPDALRGEFLIRPGQLSLDGEGDWLLRVEARSVDILLDQLPWGISMVRLPWMNRLMRVEWR